jgi:hypothetical protein
MSSTEAESLRIAGPKGFSDDEEYPIREIPDVPIWSENFWFVAYDPTARLGVWTHVGRSSWDPTLWRETVMVYLPGGDFLITKNFGRAETESGPRASCLHFEMIEPWNSGATRFDGAVVRVSREQADTGVVGEGTHLGLHMDLEWRGLAPLWAMGEADTESQTWGNTRYEQFCEVTGTVAFEDQTIDFRGTALRDHTRGARDLTPLSRHSCFNCVFPASGRAFQTVLVDIDGSEPLRRAAVLHGSELVEAQVTHDTSLLESFEQGDRPFEIGLSWPGGSATIEAELVANFPLAWGGFNEFVMGFDPEVSYAVMFEGFSRYRWDGEEAYGLTERSLRHRPGP